MKEFTEKKHSNNQKKEFQSNLSADEIIVKALQYHMEGNITEATQYYKYCIAKGIDDPRIFSNYGAILQNLGELEEAANCFFRAIKLNSNFAIAHSNLGNVLRDLGKLEKAELYIQKAIKLNPHFADAHSNLGNVLKDLGKLKDAEIAYRKAIKLDPYFANAYSNLGNVLRDLEKPEEAKLCSDKIMSLRSWSITGSYSFNYEMKLDESHNQ